MTTQLSNAPVSGRSLAGEPVEDRQRSAPRDGVTLLGAFAFLQFLIPAQYVIAPLGGAGGPARLFALGVTLWWVFQWLNSGYRVSRLRQGFLGIVFVFTVAMLTSYLAATVRPTSDTELLAADRALLNFTGWLGLLLVAATIVNRARLDTLLRRLTYFGMFEACFGLLQTVTGKTFLNYLLLPGLADTGPDGALLSRGSFLRPSGTAVHPIEYGVTLAMTLPLALHYAVADRAPGKRRIGPWIPVSVIGLALALSISRSALICTLVALGLLLPAWPPRLRRVVYGLVPFGLGGLALVLPGFLGTLVSMFSGISEDSSAASRTDSYSVAWAYISQHPFAGRGIGTFLPRYRILDNQYLGTLIEAGFVGVAATLLIFVCGVVLAWRAQRQHTARCATTERIATPGPALAAAIAAGTVSFAFFDAWSFPMVPSLMFIVMGSASSLDRFSREPGVSDDSNNAPGTVHARQALSVWDIFSSLRRHPIIAILGISLTAAGAQYAVTRPGVYYTQCQIVMVAPDITPQGNTVWAGAISLASTAALVGRRVDPFSASPLEQSNDVTIVGAGVREGVWVRPPNHGGQWATNFDRAELDVQVVSTDATRAQQRMRDTIQSIRSTLRADQVRAQVPLNRLITIGTSPSSPPVSPVQGNPARAVLATALLGIGLTSAAAVTAEAHPIRLRRRARRVVPFPPHSS